MVVELKKKSQVTIPSKIVRELNLQSGDLFDVVVKDGEIRLIPVVTYPKSYVEKLNAELSKAKHDLKEGKIKSYKSAEEATCALDSL